ncbi:MULTISPECIES: hypothetical protein [Brucella/Ochrobactrum group]|uniref:hypothetical protein n=1 Tax=Brucella/Ochrobactrum group TaxID=2826938 RepID=UPI00165672E8|nr:MULTISPECIES: hypothetical protein [Brucella/Ochrobactrum group]MBC8717901.1 hypothetical protein [Ochrobactrum sp. Marseille-Q0166]
MKPKYERVLEPTETWAIFDVTTDEPASIGDRLMIGLSERESEELLATLNAQVKSKSKRSAA